MALYGIESQRFGLKKEGTRGTAETTATVWFPTRGMAEFNYGLQHLEDSGLRGTQARYAPAAGLKVGTGKLPLFLDAQMLGEIFYSLLGANSPAQQGGTAAYKHTMTLGTDIERPAYTFFLDRGIGVLKYNLGVVKKIAIKGSVDGLTEAEAEILFKTEASGDIGSPTFPTQRYLGFQHVDFKIAGSSDTNVKEFELSMDNGAKALRTLALSQDCTNIVAPDKFGIEGGFTIYFANTTERDKFVANTSVAIRLLMEGATIASTYKYTLDVNLYDCRYTAFPYGEDQGLLAAKAQFGGFYSTGDSKQIQVDITNTNTTY